MKKPNRNPILIGTAEEIPKISDPVQAMIGEEGFYILCDENNPEKGEVMVISFAGRLFSTVPDVELDPTKFLEGTIISGPFRAGHPGNQSANQG